MAQVNLHPLISAGKQITVSLASWLLALFDEEEMWDAPLLASFMEGVRAACDHAASNQSHSYPPSMRSDSRLEQLRAEERGDVIKIFTDYEAAKHIQLQNDRVQFTESKEEADFVFTATQVKDFLSLPVRQRIGQFPYEGALVRKDLLPLTVRKYCYKDGNAPAWWNPYFDLRTEFHLFAQEHRRRTESRLPNRWIVKPAQGTRAMGHRVISDLGRDGLRQAAGATPLLPDDLLQAIAGVSSHERLQACTNCKEIVPFDGQDRIVQLFVENPLLITNRKFDMRYFVLVRNFYPLDAYVHVIRYGRLANKPYSVEALEDNQVAITVCAYDEDESIASKQERAYYTELGRLLDEQYGPGRIDVSAMQDRTVHMLRELFTGAGMEIGHWPNSSAYYGVDVLYEGPPAELEEGSMFAPQPKLVEVNFMGDWHGVEVAVGEDQQLYHQWATDLFLTLGHPNADYLPLERLTKL